MSDEQMSKQVKGGIQPRSLEQKGGQIKNFTDK